MWNIGIMARLTDSGLRPHWSAMPMTPSKKLSLVSITPLGRPVVPEV
jgi:hypothetical protein